MKLVIFGLTVSSSWGNGHATLWRGLCKSLAWRGHDIVFFERDVPWYSSARDLTELPGGGKLILYPDWNAVRTLAKQELSDADIGMVTSYCPDAIDASALVLDSATLRVFYDLDAPVTLSRLAADEPVDYAGPRGYGDFDLVLSYAGGRTLDALTTRLGARRVAPLYGSVDPAVHRPAASKPEYRADLSWMGTYSSDRDEALQALFLEPARRLPQQRFIIGGSMYDGRFPWLPNIFFVRHLAPDEHSAFHCSAKLALNVTRRAMAAFGYCPSGRLFEASACGVPILSDYWEGLEQFYEPGSEILIGRTAHNAVEALSKSPAELYRIGKSARERTLACHTADHRALDLENILQSSVNSQQAREVDAACGA